MNTWIYSILEKEKAEAASGNHPELSETILPVDHVSHWQPALKEEQDYGFSAIRFDPARNRTSLYCQV